MKLMGLIGGLGPESTIDYYQRIISGYQARFSDGSYPQIVINSVNLQRAVDLITDNKLEDLGTWLGEEVDRLARAGATMGALTANTPHIVFDAIERRSSIPLVSIVRAARDEATKRGLRRLALLGTRFTMQARFYPDVFEQAGIDLIPPPASEHEAIHDKYMNELVRGTFADATRRYFASLIETMRDRDRIDGAILAGTELPLLLRGETIGGVALLDTTDIHVRAILDAALQ